MPDADDPTHRQLVLLRVYSAFTFPFACVPLLYFYFADCGVTLDGYAWLISAYYVTMVAAEIPTGFLADRFGRVLPCVLGPILLAGSFALFASFETFEAFVVGEVLLGLGHSLLSGPPSALLYETLRRARRTDEFLKLESRLHSIRLTGTGASFLLGGITVWLADFRACILLTAPLCLVAATAALFLRDTSKRTTVRRVPILISAARDLRIPAVAWIAAFYVVLFCLLRFPFHFYQPFLRQSALEHPLFIGLLFFAMNAVAAPCARLVPAIERRIGERALFWGLLLTLSLSIWAMAGQFNWIGVALFFAHQVPFGMHWAVVQNFANHRLRDASRATVLSALSLSGRLAFAAVLPITLTFADGDVSELFFHVGFAGTVLSVACLIAGRRFLA